MLNATITLTSKDSSVFQNLKWRELTSPTKIKETSEIKAMAQSILDAGFTINSEETKSYYIAVWLSETGDNQLNTDQGLYGGIVRVTSISGEGVTASFGEIPELATNYVENLYNDGSELTTVDLGSNNATLANMSNSIANASTTVYLNPTKEIMLDNNGEYRYYGANPNNYVSFNGELWRIISISNVKSSLNDTNGELRMKIIRNESIGSYSWDSSDSTVNSGNGVNDWTQSDLRLLLNNLYYNRQSGICYTGYNNASASCDFSTKGLSDISKTLIDDAVWYLGVGNRDGFANVSYNSERSTTVYKGHPTTWTGKVGIMYPSDYGYMSDLSICHSSLISYNDDNCKNTNWTSDTSYDSWTISPFSTTTPVRGVYVSKGGLVTENNVCGGRLIYPTVYLKSDVTIIAGKGTNDNPYVLG